MSLLQINRFSTISWKIFFQFFLIFLTLPSFSQEIRVEAKDEPLNQILIKLRSEQNLMISFDDSFLSAFRLTVSKSYPDIESTLDDLLYGLPLKWEESNGVIIIYQFRLKAKATRKYVLAGRITDIGTLETLPFAGLIVNGMANASDSRGNFSLTSLTDSVFNVRISYIGYYILDTLIVASTEYNLRLTPYVTGIKEIVIKGSAIAKTIQAGNAPGIIRLNHKIAYFLPGNGDNSIFNLLRLQPGIVASGEQSADLIIWGSYEGQSQVIFDGFTVYGMKNFNDNISSVNPLMAKDLKVMKGGFGAEYGERVGGIVDITGTDGSRTKPSARVCINNMTVNGIASIPLSGNSSLLAAYRQTYYDLYNPINFSTSSYGRGRQGSQADYYLTPEYNFRDMNLKYSRTGKKTDYYLSLYGGSDHFQYDFLDETMQKIISIDHDEHNLQFGGTMFLGWTINDRIMFRTIASLSSLNSDRSHNEDITRNTGPRFSNTIHDYSNLTLNELNIRTESTIDVWENHHLESGLGMIYYYSILDDSTIISSTTNQRTNLGIPYLYVSDNININSKLSLRGGLRLNILPGQGQFYLQPRISLRYNLNNYLLLNASAGTYNQFVAKNMTIETSGNYRLAWTICGTGDIPVLNARSLSAGLTYNRNGFTFNTEGYLKTTGNISRFVETNSSTELYTGNSRVKGLDIFLKKDFRDQTFWISYTLSKTTEFFQYFPSDEYLPAMHDQRHEIKLAGLTKLWNFHFGVNYVYGSGFPDPDKLPDLVEYKQPYSRLDASLIYRVLKRKLNMDAGISVLNILNTENIRYSNYTRIPTDETNTISLYAEAVPLTPTIFLSISF